MVVLIAILLVTDVVETNPGPMGPTVRRPTRLISAGGEMTLGLNAEREVNEMFDKQ